MDRISQQELKRVLSYDEHSGEFRWLVSRSTVKAGDRSGFYDGKGYRCVSINGRNYLAHRLAWLYVYGEWPKAQIDHINGICDDNRISNLREATVGENAQNQRSARSDNRSCGLLGVTWHKPTQKWRAKIGLNGKSRHLGLFENPKAAHAAYLAAKAQIHPFSTIAEAG